MNRKNFFRSWFGYSRREQAGTLVLICIIVIVLVLSLLRSRNESGSEIITGNISESADNIPDHQETDSQPGTPELKVFDPNTASLEELCLLGLSTKQASTLINYRNSGAIFRKAEDFRKVYGLSKGLQDSIIPYIKIASQDISYARRTAGKLLPANKISDSSVSMSAINEPDIPGNDSSLPGFRIDLNSTDSLKLALLPGIGKVLSARIIKYRNLLGGYYDIQQLTEVYGIDSALFNRISGYIRSDTSAIVVSDLNSITYTELLRHPYINKECCSKILYYRKVSGSIESINKLIADRIVTMEEALKIKPYFFCDTLH